MVRLILFYGAGKPFMRRNNYMTYSRFLRNSLSLSALLCSVFCLQGYAQSSLTGNLPYNVVSANSREVIVTVHPEYQFRTVTDESTGDSYQRISFHGSSLKGIAPG